MRWRGVLVAAALGCAASGCLRDDRSCAVDENCAASEACVAGVCVEGARVDAGGGDAATPDAGGEDVGADVLDVGADLGADVGVDPAPWLILDEGELLTTPSVALLSSGRIVVAYISDMLSSDEIELRVISRSTQDVWGQPETIASSVSPPNDLLVGQDEDGGVRVLYATRDGGMISYSEGSSGSWSDGEVVLEYPEGTSGACRELDSRSSSLLAGGVGCLRSRFEPDSVAIRYTPGSVDVLASAPVFEPATPELDPANTSAYAGSLTLDERAGGGQSLLYRSGKGEIQEVERADGDAWSSPSVVVELSNSELYTDLGARLDAAIGPQGETWVAYSLEGVLGISAPSIRVEALRSSEPMGIEYPQGGAATSLEPSLDVSDEGFVFITYRSSAVGESDGELRMSVYRDGSVMDVVLDPDIGNALVSRVIVDEQGGGVHVIYQATSDGRAELRYQRWPRGAR